MKYKPHDHIIKPSTRDFIREARRARDYSLFDFLHGYFYARWPYLYIGVGVGEHPLIRILSPIATITARLFNRPANGDKKAGDGPEDYQDFKHTVADTYHGKVVPLESARQLVTVNEAIDLPDLEQVIPYSRARDIILRNPDHIVALECPCRAARENPCLPLDVCLIIGEPFAGFVMEHHSERARWISPQEATEILEAEDERGHVHHAFFKDAMLDRFYAICNCCSCCCGAMQAQRNGSPMLISSGYIAQVDEDLCIGCGTCAAFCQFEAMSVPNGHVIVDVTLCMGCGVCVNKCEQEALSLHRDLTKSEPLEIVTLQELIPQNR